MFDILAAALFAGIIATIGLGAASLYMAFFPAEADKVTTEAKSKSRFEYLFFTFSWVLCALTLWLALALT